MAEFVPALQLVLYHEGGFVDNSSDIGGATNLGVSLRFYKKKINPNATLDDIKNLTVNDAAALYKTYFWDRQPFGEIQNQKLADRVFDLVVNTGQAEGVTLLQRAVNDVDLNAHLVLDGSLGAKTLAAINKQDQDNLYAALLIEATHYYKMIAMHGNDHIFLQGWLNRLNSFPC